MKIALIQRRAFQGQFSVEGYFARLARDLKGMGHDVEQCILPHFSRGVMPRIRNVMHTRRIQGDIMHIAGDVHYTAMGCDPAKTVLTILDCATLDRLRGWRRSVFRYFWFTLPIRRCAAITVISHETKRVLIEEFPSLDPQKIRVIYVSISDLIRYSEKDFNATCPRILQVGTKGNKNVSRTILALKGLPCKLVIVGRLSDDENRTLTETGIAYENLIDVTAEQLAAEYRKCDLVTFASTIEGFGMPIVEAQMTGRPILTSNVSSMPEIAGKGACLVNPLEIASIRRGFESIVQNAEYRNELIRLGLDNSKRFQSETIAQEFVALYSEVATRASR